MTEKGTTMLQRTLTLEDFVRLYDAEGPFELINGERVTVSPTVSGHGIILKRLFKAMLAYEAETEHVEAFVETPFVLADEANWVRGSRVPDLMAFSSERLAQYREQIPDWREKPFVLVPDLVVEIISPSDTATQVKRKVDSCLADGVRLIWVVDPASRSAGVYAGERYTALTENDTLTGGAVLPGLTIALKDLLTL